MSIIFLTCYEKALSLLSKYLIAKESQPNYLRFRMTILGSHIC
jgi:hypothetical protein